MDMPTAENASKKAELTEAEVDRICPPRPETAAPFKAGTYPPAARPYREAALRAFAYIDARCLSPEPFPAFTGRRKSSAG